MWKILKSRKALSPVVASIILIAVTVAVSIAVAAWMGALTFTFMKTEQLKVLSDTWTGAPGTACQLLVKNTGSSSLTLSAVQINRITYSNSSGQGNAWTTNQLTLQAGGQATITVYPYPYGIGTSTNKVYTSGTRYEFEVFTATGNQYTWTDTAP
jgi:flagellin-like protein